MINEVFTNRSHKAVSMHEVLSERERERVCVLCVCVRGGWVERDCISYRVNKFSLANTKTALPLNKFWI